MIPQLKTAMRGFVSEEGRRVARLRFDVVQSLSRVRLCNPMGCSTPGSSVLHHFPEFAQIHVH